MIADGVKVNGGALRDRIPDLFELTFGQQQTTWYVSMSTPNCVVGMYVYVCVCTFQCVCVCVCT